MTYTDLSRRHRTYMPVGCSLCGVLVQLFGRDKSDVRQCSGWSSSPLVLWCRFGVSRPWQPWLASESQVDICTDWNHLLIKQFTSDSAKPATTKDWFAGTTINFLVLKEKPLNKCFVLVKHVSEKNQGESSTLGWHAVMTDLAEDSVYLTWIWQVRLWAPKGFLLLIYLCFLWEAWTQYSH